jgi:hypothetical protein
LYNAHWQRKTAITSFSRKMTSDDFYILTETMQKFGGHFCTKLADAIRAADSTNKHRILHAFPEMIRDYGPESRFAKAMLADKENV